jgi:hypothetical protein
MKSLVTAGILLFGFTLSIPAWAEPQQARPRHADAPVPAAHVLRHATMTEQMRSMGLDHRMHDGSWRQMRDAAHVIAEEHHQAGIDRMLARPGR